MVTHIFTNRWAYRFGDMDNQDKMILSYQRLLNLFSNHPNPFSVIGESAAAKIIP